MFFCIRSRNLSDFLIHRHFPGAGGNRCSRRGCEIPIGTKGVTRPDRDEGCNSSTREQTSTRLQTRRRRVQTSRFKNRDKGSKRPDSKIGMKGATRPDSKIRTKGANFPIQNRDEGSKKKIFFFPKASTGSVSLIIAPKVSQDCLNDQADTADHSL